MFPMETRALAIAFFFAIGTAVGGIAGPLPSPLIQAEGRVSVQLHPVSSLGLTGLRTVSSKEARMNNVARN